MSILSYLALRYLAWLIGLSVALSLLINGFGLPITPATGVILAAAPLADIGMTANRRADRPLTLGGWTLIWGACLGIYVMLRLVIPAALFAELRASLIGPEGLTLSAVMVAATGLMMALFLYIGTRIRSGEQ